MKYLKLTLGLGFVASIGAICGPSMQEMRIRGFEREILKKATKYGCGIVTTSAISGSPGVHGVYLTYCDNPKNNQGIVTAGWNRFPFGKESPYQTNTFEAFETTFDPMAISKDFRKEPKQRVVQPKQIKGDEILVTPQSFADRAPRFRCNASPELCDTSLRSGGTGSSYYSPSVQGAIASGLGAAAAAFEGFASGASPYQASFSRGVAAKDTLESVAAQMVQDAREVDQTLAADLPKWKELGAPQIEMLEMKGSLAAKAIKEEALAASNEAQTALAALGTAPAPSESAAEKSAVIGMLTEGSLVESAATEIPTQAIRTNGADLGGLMDELRARSFDAKASPAERQIAREYRKWKGVRGHRREEVRARELLSMASRFASGGGFREAEALTEEARSLRYFAKGISPTKEMAVIAESGTEVQTFSPSNDPANLLAKAVQNFEATQSEIAFKERILQAQIFSQEPGEKLRYRDEAALSITSALRKIAGQQFYRGQRKASEGSQAMANGVVDLSLSLIPGVNVVKDFFELLSGRSVVTGEELTKVERAFAAMGVVTLGLTTEGKALAKLAGKALKAQKPVEEAFRAAEQLIAATANSSPARNFLERLHTAYREGAIELPYVLEDVQTVFEQYPDLYRKLKEVTGVEMDLDFVRAIGEKYWSNALGRSVDAFFEDVFKWHPGMLWKNHRFSIGGSAGREALYATLITKDSDAVAATKTALQEAGLLDKAHFVDRAQMRGKKVLDLTDDTILAHLGLTKDMLTAPPSPKNGYLIPQMIGDIATELGFTHIISRSAENLKSTNVIHLVKVKP